MSLTTPHSAFSFGKLRSQRTKIQVFFKQFEIEGGVDLGPRKGDEGGNKSGSGPGATGPSGTATGAVAGAAAGAAAGSAAGSGGGGLGGGSWGGGGGGGGGVANDIGPGGRPGRGGGGGGGGKGGQYREAPEPEPPCTKKLDEKCTNTKDCRTSGCPATNTTYSYDIANLSYCVWGDCYDVLCQALNFDQHWGPYCVYKTKDGGRCYSFVSATGGTLVTQNQCATREQLDEWSGLPVKRKKKKQQKSGADDDSE